MPSYRGRYKLGGVLALLSISFAASAAQPISVPTRIYGAISPVPPISVLVQHNAVSALSLQATWSPLGMPTRFAPLPWVKTANSLIVPAKLAPGALTETGRAFLTGQEVGTAIRNPAAAPISDVLSAAFDGRKLTPPTSNAPLRATSATLPAGTRTDYLQKTPGKVGRDLLLALHDATGRKYRTNDYLVASQYLFSSVDNITSHGVHGVVDAYSGIFVPGTSNNGNHYKENGDQNGDGWVDRDGMNVEHTWPQSFFNRSLPMRSDLHHLLTTFMHPNSLRGNLPFGEVGKAREYSNNGGAKIGGGVFEPPDFSKGKVARAVLYFYMRYFDRNITQGNFNRRFWDNNLEMFLRWNREHPPDSDELIRNNRVESFQGNRNPFIDDPSLAERIGIDGFRQTTYTKVSTRSDPRQLAATPKHKKHRQQKHHKHHQRRRH